MDKQEYLDRINAIGSCEDDAERLTLLNNLRDDVCGIIDENEKLTGTNATFVEENEKLRSANMNLFLQLGEQKSKAEQIENNTGEKPEDKEPRKFENLFNEKGFIK